MYAEEVGHYWKTSQSSPDSWMHKTKRLIEKSGGQVLAEGFGNEPLTGRSAYMLMFEINGDHFKVVWPVLPSKAGNERAARIQATTMMYHDVKARCVTAKVLGSRVAFFSYLMLPDGRTMAAVSTPELAQIVPDLFVRQLTPGENDRDA